MDAAAFYACHQKLVLDCRLQQLCTWAAKPSEGNKVESQTTMPGVEKASQQTSRQVETGYLLHNVAPIMIEAERQLPSCRCLESLLLPI